MDPKGIIVTCPDCGQRNRVPFGREAKCGKCSTRLSGPAEPVEVPSVEAFDALAGSVQEPIVIDFWAPWCGPCRIVAPELVKVAQSNAGRWLIVKVNTEALPELGERFQIRSIPTMAVIMEGKEIARTAGARPAADIESFVRQALSRQAQVR